jgi:hypothetical protein
MGKMLIVMGTVITGLVVACVSLTASVNALQAEVSKLETRQTAADGAAAASGPKIGEGPICSSGCVRTGATNRA